MINSRIIGTGSYLPEKVITNQDWEKRLDTSDEWITTRTGIKERKWTTAEQATSDLCVEAGKRALAAAKLNPDDIDVLITATITPDHAFPSTSCIIQHRMNMRTIPAFDIAAACTGFLYGLEIARNLIGSGRYKYIMVFGAECLSKITDVQDRSSAVLFGDGAGCAILGPSEDPQRGILSFNWHSDGSLGKLLIQPGGGSRNPASHETVDKRMHTIQMLGNETYKHAVSKMGQAAVDALNAAGLTGKDVDVFIPHQANLRIMQSTAKRAKVALEKVYITVDKYGNMSAATVPIAMDDAVRDGTLKPGSILLLDAFGGGLTWAAAVIRW